MPQCSSGIKSARQAPAAIQQKLQQLQVECLRCGWKGLRSQWQDHPCNVMSTGESAETPLDRARILSIKGRTAYAEGKGNAQEAVDYYSEALEALATGTQKRTQKIKAASADMEKMKALVLASRAECRVSQEKWELAIEDATESTTADPQSSSSVGAYCALGLALRKTDRLPQAVKELAAGCQQHPTNAKLRALKESCVSALDAWVSALPPSDRQQVEKGIVAKELQQFRHGTKAGKLLSEAEALKDAGNDLYRSKRFTDAAQKYSDALSILTNESTDSNSSKQPSKSKKGGGDQKKASAESTTPTATTTTASPEVCKLVGILLSNRAQCHIESSQWELAVRDAGAACQSDPKNVKAYYRRGLALKKWGRVPAAVDVLKAGVALARESCLEGTPQRVQQ